MPSPVRPPESHDDDDSDEVDALKREVERLRASRHRGGWWRPVVAGLLIVLAAVVAPLSVIATWSEGQISDTDRYLETVGPLASDPDVQDAIATRIEQVVFTHLDLDAATQQLAAALDAPGLPPRAAETLRALSGPLTSAIEGFVRDRIAALVRSDAFETAWVDANRTAHDELVSALTGEGSDAVEVDRGTVSVNLAVLVNTVKQQLVANGFEIANRIPEVDASFEILHSDDITKVQDALRWIGTLSTWLPVIGLGAIAGAVAVARDKRRTLLAAGLAVAASMLLLGAALNVGRVFYLDALPASSSQAAAGVLYDQIVSFIRLALRGVLVVALTVAVVAWLSASHGTGRSAREGLTRGLGLLRRNALIGRVHASGTGAALAQYRGPLRIVIVGAAALGYLMQDHPTGSTAVVFVVVTGVILFLVELLAAPTPPDAGAPDAADEPSSPDAAAPSQETASR